MSDMTDETPNEEIDMPGDEIDPTLMRYVRSLSRLRSDLQRTIYMEMYQGLGDTAIRTYNGLHTAISAEFDDPYLETLRVEAPPEMQDKQKVALVTLLAGQLLSYLEEDVEAFGSFGDDGPPPGPPFMHGEWRGRGERRGSRSRRGRRGSRRHGEHHRGHHEHGPTSIRIRAERVFGDDDVEDV